MEQDDQFGFKHVYMPGIGYAVVARSSLLDPSDSVGWINAAPETNDPRPAQVFVAPRPPQAQADNWIRHIRNSYHFGKSENEVRAEVDRRWNDPTRTKSEIRLGCFKELDDAVRLVESAKASGAADIENVRNGKKRESALRLADVPYVTGVEYIRNEQDNKILVREVHSAVVVIRHDEVIGDYYVVTAYPKGPRDPHL